MKKMLNGLAAMLLLVVVAGMADEGVSKQRDIEILENILGRLVQGDVRTFFPNMNARGSILEGYGVIFYVPYTFSGVKTMGTVKPDSQGVKGVFQLYSSTGYGEKSEETIDKKMTDFKSALTTFFGDYAGVLNLPAADRITVVVEIQNPHIYSAGYQETGGSQLLYASLRGDQLASARKGGLSREALGKAIIYSDGREEGRSFEDITIFAGILDEAMTEKDGLRLDTSRGTRGVYFPGFGVVFMASPISSPNVLLSTLSRSRSKYRAAREDDEPVNVSEPEVEEQLSRVKENIIEILAQYGGALKTPKEDECVLVMVESGMFGFDQSDSRMSIKADMKDIRAASREEMKMETFKDKVRVWEP